MASRVGSEEKMKRTWSVSVITLILGILLFSGAAGAVDSPYDGWWYVKNQGGTGVSIEIQGSNLFLAMYFFEQSGQSAWLISGGPMSGATSYSGGLVSYAGAPPNPTSSVVGSVQITFNSATQATLTWSVGALSGSKTLTKFMDDQLGGGADDLRDINGWWWAGSAYTGTGFFLEVQGNALFMAWYHYRGDGTPVWWTAFANPGDFINGSSSFTGAWSDYQNGQTLDGDWKNPTPTGAGALTLTINGYSSITLSTGGVQYSLERFRLGQFSAIPAMAYTGKTNQAVITEQNAVALVMGGLNGVSAIGAFGDLLSGISLSNQKENAQEVGLSEKALQTIHELAEVYDDVIYGNCGGSIAYTLNVNQSTFDITGSFTASSFCNNGATLNGVATLSAGVNQSSQSSGDVNLGMDMQEMTFTSSTENLTIDGQIAGTAHINTNNTANTTASVTANALTRDNNLSMVYKLDNYTLTLTSISQNILNDPTAGSAAFTLTGRFFHPAFGYIDTVSDGPVQISGSGGVTGGTINAQGASNTKSKVTVLSRETFQVQADTNGDGVYNWNSGPLRTSDFFPVSGGIPAPNPPSSSGTAYWSVYNQVCCNNGTYNTFQASLEGVSLGMTNPDCGALGSAPGFVPVSAGQKSFTWIVDAGCANLSGTITATLQNGQCYRVTRYFDSVSGVGVVEVLVDNNCPY